ncbi:glycosyltransferase [Butyrivibrio proteoclasticus]|uniref:glycosyltransferase n=1 Tax=Butyrivibrio proteoclasticus TaxID=43305 RepID=UPI00047D1AFD|nr:glycosyltransferase [Butyrivibrio proteoclasticus]
MAKKRILMVCEAYTGGVFSYVTQLCNDMCDEFDVSLAFSVNAVKKRRPATPSNFRQLLDARVGLYEVKDFGNLKKIWNTIRRLREIAQEVQPDIIHLHSSIAGGIGRIAFDGKKSKLVYTPHGYSFVLMGNGLKSKIMFCAEWILGKKNAITLVCTPSEELVAKKITNRTLFIETGVNVEELDDALKNIEPVKNSKFTVYTLGRICSQKRPALFNRIAELVPEADFVWVGSGELEKELAAPNLKVTGWMPRHDALSIGKGADAYVLCSYGEAVAMSLVENMFMGKLCLVSDVMGNKDVIKDGRNGYLCAREEEYAKRIKEAMHEFPKQLGEQAKMDVMNVYNTKVMKEKFINFYNGI